MIVVKRAAVGLVAVLSSIIPVAEIGLFSYETFVAQEQEADWRDQAFQELMAFQGRIMLQAAEAELRPEGEQRTEDLVRIQQAIDRWDDAFRLWRDGDHGALYAALVGGRVLLQADGPGSVTDPPPEWATEEARPPSFPWLTVAIPGVVAIVAWGAYLGWRRRKRAARD